MTLKLTVQRINEWDNGNDRVLQVNMTLPDGNTKEFNVTFRKEDVERECVEPDGKIGFYFKKDAKITFRSQLLYLEVTDKTLPDMMQDFCRYDMISQEFLKLVTVDHDQLKDQGRLYSAGVASRHFDLMCGRGNVEAVRQYLLQNRGVDVSGVLSNIRGRAINMCIT